MECWEWVENMAELEDTEAPSDLSNNAVLSSRDLWLDGTDRCWVWVSEQLTLVLKPSLPRLSLPASPALCLPALSLRTEINCGLSGDVEYNFID